jgi:hypothetical protein
MSVPEEDAEPETDFNSNDATSVSEGECDHKCLRLGCKVPVAKNSACASTLLLPSMFQTQPTTHRPYQQETYLAQGKPKEKVPLNAIHEAELHSLNWNLFTFLTLNSFDIRCALRYPLCTQEEGLAWHPSALLAKAKGPEVNPTWEQAMNRPYGQLHGSRSKRDQNS